MAPSFDAALVQLESAILALAQATGEQVGEAAAAIAATRIGSLVAGYGVGLGGLLLSEAQIFGRWTIRRRVTGLCRACLMPLELRVEVEVEASQNRPITFGAAEIGVAIDAVGQRLVSPGLVADQLASLLVDAAGAATVEVSVGVERPCLGCPNVAIAARVVRSRPGQIVNIDGDA